MLSVLFFGLKCIVWLTSGMSVSLSRDLSIAILIQYLQGSSATDFKMFYYISASEII